MEQLFATPVGPPSKIVIGKLPPVPSRWESSSS